MRDEEEFVANASRWKIRTPQFTFKSMSAR